MSSAWEELKKGVFTVFVLYHIAAATLHYEESFPLIRLSRRRARDKKWITPGIKASVRKKSKLYKKWIASGNESDGLIFKTYRKIFKSVLKEAKKPVLSCDIRY